MDVLLNKYTILKEINRGAFGNIYLGVNKSTSDKVAIKIENKENSLIINEARIYKLLEKTSGVPKLRMYLNDDKYNYLIIDLLGESLYSLKSNSSFFLSNDIIYKIGTKLINIINDIHNIGIVHRDIKPQNILFDKFYEKIYLIDFGFAKKIINSAHIKERKISNIIGSPNYISINVHNLIEPSRRDDIISIIYILFYLLLNELPWKNKSNEETMRVKKNLINQSDLIYIKKYKNLIDILIYLEKLNFSSKPNYNYILEMLKCF